MKKSSMFFKILTINILVNTEVKILGIRKNISIVGS
jgi:hypothetical protein